MRESNISVTGLDLFDGAFRADPYPAYRRLQENDPVHWSRRHRCWVLTRYEHASRLLNAPGVCHWSAAALDGKPQNSDPTFPRLLSRWMTLLDPRQGDMRRRIAGIFDPKAMSRIAEVLRAEGRRRLDDAKQRGAIELIHGLAEPMALAAMTELFGVPESMRDVFHQFARAVAGSLHASVEAVISPVTLPGFLSLFREIEERKNSEGRGLDSDLLTILWEALAEGKLDENELAASVLFFLFAGHENIMNFIGNAAFTLATHLESYAALSNGGVNAAVVDELLRYDSPVQFMTIQVGEPVELARKTINPGEQVLVCTGAANRDPAHFGDPDRIDFARTPNRHLSFGAGPLTCLGASVARMQGQIAITMLVERLSRLELLDEAIVWRTTPPVLRGPESLTLRMGV